MKFQVPNIKDGKFNLLFFQFLSDRISDVVRDTEKRPDKITFTGRIGRELLDLINEMGWNFADFNPSHINGPTNKIIIEYTKPLDQVEDKSIPNADSFDGKIVEGIPSEATMNKIINHASTPMFRIERKIKPKIEVILHR